MKTIQSNHSHSEEWISRMRGISLFIFLSSFFIFFSSCTSVDLEDMPDPTPPTPQQGQVTLTTDWTNSTTGIAVPASYIVTINNQTLNYTNASNQLPQLSAGTYPILIHNTADKINISQTTATVTTTNGIVDPMPGWLFTSALDIVYEDDKQKEVTAVMQQQVKQLTLTLKPEGGTVDKIETISAQLSGIAGAWNFVTNLPSGNALNVPLVFVKQTNGTWQATVHLLGIVGREQKLSGTITFENGEPAAMTLDGNLSTSLVNFNTDKKTPLSLQGEMQETPTEFGLTSVISSWELGNGSGNSGSAE